MYIHSYQIHNVLNAYRKQLSQGPGATVSQTPDRAPAGDSVEISANAQRQTLIDQVSTEIVDRIAQYKPQNHFEEEVTRQLDRARTGGPMGAEKREVEFTYTAIDENDRKTTNSLPIQRFSPLIGQLVNTVEEATGNTG
jgi:hypothetical protein